jgi:hypothetical protein
MRRVQAFGGLEVALPPRCAGYEGYNLHAGVPLKASEREALERLLRYTLRPPLAKERLSVKDDGTLVMGDEAGLERRYAQSGVLESRLRGEARGARTATACQPDRLSRIARAECGSAPWS